MMAMKIIALLLPALFLACAPARAQVIEIDSSGEWRTYDGPTLFTEDGSDAIGKEEARRSSAANVDASNLLAQVAVTHGVDPGLLKAVAWQESRGRMNAVSVKGALGVMQLMPGTAAELGVNPTDLADNIRGGAMYLRRQLDRFGSVPLALAAYNAGPGAVLRYGGVPPYRETRDYVTKIMQRWTPSKPTASAPTLPPPLQTQTMVIEVP
jgi:soluble lytic murein transglycosylase-like protein